MVAPVMVGREKEYYAWVDMRRRCSQEHRSNYARYGGRGISVCEEWNESFEKFYSDMGPRPDGHSLDRIDNDGNYTPENCKWSTPTEQARNRRSTKLVKAFGEAKTVAEWMEDDRCSANNRHLLFERLSRGWEPEKAISTPAKKMGGVL